MNIRESIAEMRAFRADCKTCAEPRRDSPWREVELAVKVAREDVCANIYLAITVLLIATGCHHLVCFTAVCLTVSQFAEAVKWESLLRLERVRKMKGIK